MISGSLYVNIILNILTEGMMVMPDSDMQQRIIDALKSSFAFTSELSDLQLEMLARYSTLQELAAGTVIAESINDCPGIALVVSGEIRVSRLADDGREVIVYKTGKGRTCPLSTACLLGSFDSYRAKVFTGTDAKVVWVSKDFTSKSMKECEPFWRFVFGCLAKSLFAAIEVVDTIAFIPIRKRLAQSLLTQSNSGKHPIYTTHDALAKELGTAREVVSRELKGFERAGIIDMARGRLTLKKVDELQNYTI